MSYSMIQKQLGADLWTNLTNAFTGATSAAKSGASVAWAATKSAASAAYQEDMNKQLSCQQNAQLSGLGELKQYSGDIYYDTETGECVQLSKEEQKKSCESTGGVWTAQQFKGKPIFGCMPKAEYDKIPKKGECQSESYYPYAQAVQFCGAPKDEALKSAHAKKGEILVWRTSSAGRPAHWLPICDSKHELMWKEGESGFAERSGCVLKGQSSTTVPSPSQRYTDAPKGFDAFGATGSKPRSFIIPADAPILYPTPEASADEIAARSVSAPAQTSPGESSWWSQRSTPEKVGMIGGAAVVGLGLLYLAVG